MELKTWSPVEPEEKGAYDPAKTQAIKITAIAAALDGQSELMKPVEHTDINDVDAVQAVAERYINSCAGSGILPNVEGLCCALGVSRTWFYKFVQNHSGESSANYLNQLRQSWASLRIALGERGILNPAVSIFLLKNSGLGYSDQPQNELEERPDPFRPAWAAGMSNEAYLQAIRREFESVTDELPEENSDEGI